MSACKFCGDDPDAAVSARWEFTMPLAWPTIQSGHKLANTKGGNWRYREIRQAFVSAVLAAARDKSVPAQAGLVRRVVLTRLWAKRGRALDQGNLVAGAKPIDDALVTAGLLFDDAAKYARIHHHQRRAVDGVPAIHVLIEELSCGA